jgi:transposase InsO family protein
LPLDPYRSFQGVQYTALSFGKRLEEVGIIPSMGRVGSALDNAIKLGIVRGEAEDGVGE